MLKVKITDSGDLNVVAAEILSVINDVYITIKRQNPAAADSFRYLIRECITDPETPVFRIESNHDSMCIVTKKNK